MAILCRVIGALCEPRANPPVAPGFVATVWPALSPNDSGAQRRKKVAVRAAQLAVAIMIAAGVVGAVATDFNSFAGLHLAALLVSALAYTAWSLRGMREPIGRLLAEHAQPPVEPRCTLRRVVYFAIQLALAGLVFTLSNNVRGGALGWLVLLPPVAHSVILLPRGGIALVATLTMALLAANVGLRQGPALLASGTVAFAFAVLFTVIFSLLAVSAERSRGEVQKLADELAVANRKLREYAVEAEELAATRERNRLAREIHDSLGHYLTVVNVQLEAARAIQSRDEARCRDALDKAQRLTQEGLKEIRRSVSALRAMPLDNQTLPCALERVVEDARASGLVVRLEVKGAPRELPPAAELTLYRAAQEGLTNVRKHAGCSDATVSLSYDDASKVRLTVSDSGAGAAESAFSAGFGLLGVRERAHLLGGEVRTQTAPGAGFTLEVEVPG